jgi:hypothetical protein
VSRVLIPLFALSLTIMGCDTRRLNECGLVRQLTNSELNRVRETLATAADAGAPRPDYALVGQDLEALAETLSNLAITDPVLRDAVAAYSAALRQSGARSAEFARELRRGRKGSPPRTLSKSKPELAAVRTARERIERACQLSDK